MLSLVQAILCLVNGIYSNTEAYKIFNILNLGGGTYQAYEHGSHSGPDRCSLALGVNICCLYSELKDFSANELLLVVLIKVCSVCCLLFATEDRTENSQRSHHRALSCTPGKKLLFIRKALQSANSIKVFHGFPRS
jgi:hypothetical protein